ncbi:MAG: nucleotidyltransferase family protein, partial [Candidatus Aureabacteria bacterium]|nr:nucleotidyltransferase family protein [Candidatus Auribacterota bacterium]
MSFSWNMSHLPFLSDKDRTLLLITMRSWFCKEPIDVSGLNNPDLFWEYTVRHGLSGILGSMVLNNLLNHPGINSRAVDWYRSHLLQHEQSLHVCRRVEQEAQLAGIPIVFVKGPAIALQAYTQEPGVRSYSDIDVLVPSREEALRLIRTLTGKEAEVPEEIRWDRLMHPGRLHIMLRDWEVEFAHPMDPSPDPMFDFIRMHQNQLFKIPGPEVPFTVPDVSLHMIFLIQHMVRHLCNRLIWYMDLAVLHLAHEKDLDWDFISHELEKLELKNMASLISLFCIQQVNPAFPRIPFGKKGWNTAFQKIVVSPEQIHSTLSLHHESRVLHYYTRILSTLRYVLIADPHPQTSLFRRLPCHWLSVRLVHSQGWKSSFWIPFFQALFVGIYICLFPIVWLLCYSFVGIFLAEKSFLKSRRNDAQILLSG